jgi:hypothetical protein
VARWEDVVAAEPDFARRVSDLFEARRHKTIATLRKDGSPRVSGIETSFQNGQLIMGMMAGSVKANDIRRDPRVAIHCTSDDPPQDDPTVWLGDAKIAGTAIEMWNEAEPADAYLRIDISEVVLTRVANPADHLAIESWHQDRGYRLQKRY